MNNRLRYQHSIEGICVQGRQSARIECGLFVDRERRDAARCADPRNEDLGAFRKRQAAQRVFDADLPG